MKSNYLLFLILICSFCYGQSNDTLTYNYVKPKLVNFLKIEKQVSDKVATDILNGEYSFNFVGFFNSKSFKVLKDGLYVFSTNRTDCKVYFVIVENSDFKIINLTTQDQLKDAISLILDFSERKKYCISITSEIIKSFLHAYYNINLDPLNRTHINCLKGITTTDDLP